jgi:HAD superfamily phosphoserine phosphatase-like hydrolase
MEIVSDFDGTIVNVDTVEYLLVQYANGDWRRYDVLFEKGEITLEECLSLQYGMIKEPKQKLLDAVDDVASFRTGLDDLLAFSERKGNSFTIVSAGLDFVITHLLRRMNVQNQIVVLAPKSKPTSRGIVLDFSRLPQGDSPNFKSNAVRSIKAKGTKVAYVGDGFSDFEAIKEANVRFVIKGSRLAEQCNKDGILCHEIVGLEEVTYYLTSPRTQGGGDVEAKSA